MNIRFSDRDEKKIPTIEELRRSAPRAYHVLSEKVLSDGRIEQIIITNNGGKQKRVLPPNRLNVEQVVSQSFNLGYRSSDESNVTIAGYSGYAFDFIKYEAKAKTMSDSELWYSLRDAVEAKKAMRTMEATDQENWYADEASVYRKEITKRSGKVPLIASIKISNRDQKNFVMVDNQSPNWEPLEKMFSDNTKMLSDFMYMGAIKMINNNVIYLYKNRNTRRYINIDNTGNTFEYVENTYTPIGNATAKMKVLN